MAPYVVLYKPVFESLQLILKEPSLELEYDENDAHKVFNDIPNPEIRTLMKEVYNKIHRDNSRVCKKPHFTSKVVVSTVDTSLPSTSESSSSSSKQNEEPKRPAKRRMDHADSRVPDDIGKLSKKKKSNQGN